MLQQENRLTKVRDFNLLMKHGFWVRGTFLDLRFLNLAKIQGYIPKKTNPESFKKQLRLAIVVGLKVDKSAVRRNRLKRQMREVVRLYIKEGRIKDGFYGMLAARKAALGKNYIEISQEIELLLKRGDLFSQDRRL